MNRFSIDYTPTSYYTPITVAFVSNDDVHASQSVTAEVYLSFGNERTKTSFCVPGVKKNGLWIFTYDPREVLEDYPRLSSRGTWRASISFNPFEKDGIEAFTHPRRNTINLICEPLVEGSRIVYYKDAFNLPAYLRLDNLTVVTTPKITKGVIGTQRVNVETEIETKYEYESEPLCREKLNDFLALSISRDIRFDSPKGERLVILECELKETEGFHKRPTVKLVITPAATSPSFGEGEPHNLFNSPFSTVFD